MPATTWTISSVSIMIFVAIITRLGCIVRVQDENDVTNWNVEFTFGANETNNTPDIFPSKYQPFINACKYIGDNSSFEQK